MSRNRGEFYLTERDKERKEGEKEERKEREAKKETFMDRERRKMKIEYFFSSYRNHTCHFTNLQGSSRTIKHRKEIKRIPMGLFIFNTAPYQP